jgi:hypothetical protein
MASGIHRAAREGANLSPALVRLVVCAGTRDRLPIGLLTKARCCTYDLLGMRDR